MKILATAVLLGSLIFFSKIHADPITLDTTTYNSLVYQQATTEAPGGTVNSEEDPVSSLPNAGSPTATYGLNSGTTTAALTTSNLTFNFTEDAPDPSGEGDVYGDSGIFFIAGANVTYSISGGATNLDTTGGDDFNIDLTNVTTDESPVAIGSYTQGVTSYTLAGELGSSATGSLVSGDQYEFFAYEDTSGVYEGPDSSTAHVTIAFTQSVPEPSSASLLAVGAAVLGGLWLIRRHSETSS